MTDRAGALTVFYDGSCPMCTTEIGIYRRCAGVEAVAFVDVSTNESGTIVSGLDKATAVGRFHLRDADGTLVSGAQAFKGPALVEIMTDAELV